MKGIRWLVITYSILAGALSVQGGLLWSTRTVRLSAAFGQATVEADFPFQNQTSRTINVSARANCDCILAAVPEPHIAPGAPGIVHVTFLTNGLSGHQQRVVLVTSSDAPRQPETISLEVDIPVLATVDPKVVVWDPVNPTAPKAINITLNKKADASVVSVESDTPDVVPSLQAVEERHRYRVNLDVRQGRYAEAATLTFGIRTQGRIVTYSAVVIVRK